MSAKLKICVVLSLVAVLTAIVALSAKSGVARETVVAGQQSGSQETAGPVIPARNAAPVPTIGDISSMASIGRGTVQPLSDTERADAERKIINFWDKGTEDGAIPMEGMTFPIAVYPDGRVRAQFSADYALLPQREDAFVSAKNILVESFSEMGVYEGGFVADNCVFDRVTRVGYCDGPVCITYRGVRITGSNMVWNLDTRSSKILLKPEVRFNRFMQSLGSVFRK